MHRFVCILAAIIASGSAKSLLSQMPQAFIADYPDMTSPFSQGTTNLSISILSVLANPHSLPSANSNIFFSPLGVASTLTLMRMCSSGHTRDEFNNLPIFQTSNDVTESFNDLYESLADPPNRRSRRRVSELDSSNLIFLQESLDYTDKFVERVAAFDNLDVMLVNFSGQPQISRVAINEMINTKTRGLIPRLFSPSDINSETQLVISNTVYFQGIWRQRFMAANETLEYFQLEDGRIVNAPMMTNTYQYKNHILCNQQGNTTECGNSSIPDMIELPFRDGRRKMVILMPNERVRSLGEIKRRFARENEKWRGSLRKSYVTVTMPSFKLDYEVNLKNVLRNQGLGNVFDSRTADFSDLSSRPLQFTKFIHKTSITVNQNGVTLAAGSGLTALIRLTYRELATNTMLVNRPFLFFIEDSTTKMMIFLGQVTDPR